ncbi:MAG: hypothetical protein P4M11_09340 [Candidatus Pacebacteria bacterium]|nr:hypothetical protein [Candidatus Paceibacterota bacterium]
MKKHQPKFYEDYAPFPAISAARITVFRKRLFGYIDVPVDNEKRPLVQSVQIQILTPVLSSQTGRKIGRMHIFEPANKPKPCLQPKSATKSPAKGILHFKLERTEEAELPRLTVSQKKMQRNAQLTGVSLDGVGAVPPIRSSLAQLSSMWQHTPQEPKRNDNDAIKDKEKPRKELATIQSHTSSKRRHMKNALRFMIDTALYFRGLVGNNHGSPVLQFSSATQTIKKDPSPPRPPLSAFATPREGSTSQKPSPEDNTARLLEHKKKKKAAEKPPLVLPKEVKEMLMQHMEEHKRTHATNAKHGSISIIKKPPIMEEGKPVVERRRRNTLVVPRGDIGSLIGALEQLALAPIHKEMP